MTTTIQDDIEIVVWEFEKQLSEIVEFINEDFRNRYDSWPQEVTTALAEYLFGLQLDLERVLDVLEPDEEEG